MLHASEGSETRENGDAHSRVGRLSEHRGSGPFRDPEEEPLLLQPAPEFDRSMTCEFQIVSLTSEGKVPCPWLPTCDHEELLQVLDDVNLEDCSDSWDVGEEFFKTFSAYSPSSVPTSTTCQGASPRGEERRAGPCPHYHPLTRSCNACGYGQIPADVPKEHRHLVAEGQCTVHVQTVITFQFQPRFQAISFHM